MDGLLHSFVESNVSVGIAHCKRMKIGNTVFVTARFTSDVCFYLFRYTNNSKTWGGGLF